MAKAKQNDMFGNMTYAELKKWSQDHDDEWESGIPDWSDNYWKSLERAAKKEFPTMNLMQLIEIWMDMEEGEFDTTGDFCMDAMLGQEPIAHILEKIKEQNDLITKLQISLEVLLKQHEQEPANIKVGQLNRLKGGL